MVTVSIVLSIIFGIAAFIALLIYFRKELNGNPIDSDDLSFIAFSFFFVELIAISIGLFWFIVFLITIIVGGVLLFIYWNTFKQFWKEWKDGRN